MPKPFLIDEDSRLESEIVATLLAGLNEWRPDLHYPESHSDMQGCVRGLLKMYEVKRRALPAPLRLKCPVCRGLGEFISFLVDNAQKVERCKDCDGKGWVPG